MLLQRHAEPGWYWHGAQWRIGGRSFMVIVRMYAPADSHEQFSDSHCLLPKLQGPVFPSSRSSE